MKNKIELLDCQVDLILESLQLYIHVYTYMYPKNKKSKTLEENLKTTLVTDTYNQILSEFTESKKENKKFKKIS